MTGINSNFGDTATIDGRNLLLSIPFCQEFEGVASGSEPTTVTSKTACLGADGQL
jgi:hypothetical protein